MDHNRWQDLDFPIWQPSKSCLSLSSCGTVHGRSWWCLLTDTALCSIGLFPYVLWWRGSSVLEVSLTQGGQRLGAPESLGHDCIFTTRQRWYCSGSPLSWPCSMQVFGTQWIRSMTVTSVMLEMFRWHQILLCRRLHNDCFQKCFMQLY